MMIFRDIRIVLALSNLGFAPKPYSSYSLPAQNLRKGYRLFKVHLLADFTNKKKQTTLWVVCFFLAAELGIEPRQRDSETLVLPLHNSAKLRSLLRTVILYPNFSVCQEILQKFCNISRKKAESEENSLGLPEKCFISGPARKPGSSS